MQKKSWETGRDNASVIGTIDMFEGKNGMRLNGDESDDYGKYKYTQTRADNTTGSR